MTIGEKLLGLSAEYQRAMDAGEWPQYGVTASHREPSVIAAEYEAALLELLATR